MRDRQKRKLLQAVRETQAHQTMKSVAFSLIQAGDLRVYSAHLCGRAAACADTRLRVILQSRRWVLQLELEMRQPRVRNVTAFSECFPIWNSHLLFLFFPQTQGAITPLPPLLSLLPLQIPHNRPSTKKAEILFRYLYGGVIFTLLWKSACT